MELTIKGNPEEIKNVLQAIASSEKHINTENQLRILSNQIAQIHKRLRDFPS